MSEILQEGFSGHAVVKSFTAEELESARFRRAAQRFRQASLRYIAQQALPSPIIEFFGAPSPSSACSPTRASRSRRTR